MGNTDKHYLEGLKKGNQDSISFLYKKYYGHVFHFASLYINNESDVKDIVQDVFLKVWSNRSKVDPTQNFENYLFIITRNHIFNIKRQIKNKFTFITTLDALDIYSEAFDEDLEMKEVKEIIEEVIDSLPNRQKEIFILSRKYSLTNRSISEQLKISIKTVESHMTKALATIRKAINNL